MDRSPGAERASRTKGREATMGVIPGRFSLSVGLPALPAPMGWRWTRLGEVAQLESGHTPSRKHPNYWDGGVPWIGIKDAVDGHGRTINDTYQHVSQLGLENSSARLLPQGTVCLSRTASVGYVVVMGREMCTSQDFVNWVCGPGIEPDYLKYVLLAERDSLFRFASGTTHQTIYYPEAKAFHVLLPPPMEQRRVVSILRALDDKIELNRRMNETLEAMARALFKSWFVGFDPVRARAAGRQPAGMNAEMAALFPDKLVDSDVGEVPAGWVVKPLDQCAEFLNGLALQKYPPDASGNLPVIKIAQLRAGNTTGADSASAGLPIQYIINDGDLLFSWSGSLEVARWAGGKGALNQHLFKVTPKSLPQWFVHQWLLNHLGGFRAIAAAKATTMGHIQRHHLTQALVVVPETSLLNHATALLQRLGDRVLENWLENRTLGELRDALLPQLLSGQLRVGDA